MSTYSSHPQRRGATRMTAAVLAALLAASVPAWADKPSWAGGGRGNDQGQQRGWEDGHGNRKDPHRRQHDDRDHRRDRDDHRGRDDHRSRAPAPRVVYGSYFNDHQRVVVRQYYEPQWRAGRCPPGLAKKNNGCMPPGQARKWRVGQPLPRGVTYYAVPQPIVVQLGVPPSGYRYVRVAGDILLMAIGTSMVVDAIQDIAGY
ncbi:hypothetical protein [Ottowia sp. VDI28]|uniref:hypothetical protein n=1 Tax=Ottowia sp. VDI28 TaxID=3133968 RepID=UPI003C2D161B